MCLSRDERSNLDGVAPTAGEADEKLMAPPISHRRRLWTFRWRPWLRQVWSYHFGVSLLVLLWGILKNPGTRKYVPINSTSAVELYPGCEKAFLNVFAESAMDDEAVVCCSPLSPTLTAYGVCHATPSYLFLATRLTQFPDAWLIPLFPMILGAILKLLFRVGKSALPSKYTLRRLVFYVLLMNLRGWILYVGMGKLESWWIPPVSGTCWYGDYLRPDQPSCYGRAFDFSDHIVLFMAQTLPIALMEALHRIVAPAVVVGVSIPTTNDGSDGSSFRRNLASVVNPMVLLPLQAYLSVLAFMGAITTATYFHTGGEVIVGYIVSLSIQLPLCYLQCGGSYWQGAREFFFGYPLAMAHAHPPGSIFKATKTSL